MRFLLLSAIILAIAQTQVLGQDDYCLGKDREQVQTRHFSSLTAYEIAKGTNMDKQYLVPGCEPQKIWILHRHGTRLPNKSVIQNAPRLEKLRTEISDNYKVHHTKPDTNALCFEDLAALRMWNWNTSITVDQEQYLTSQGYADLKGTARLYQRYYPSILTRDYNKNQFLFRHDRSQSSTESFKAFAEGLFGSNSYVKAEPMPEKDHFLQPHQYCNSWKEHDYDGPDSELHRFKQSQIWQNLLKEISTRLGFRYTLAGEDVELMFDICRYEQAWKVDRLSIWCAAFTPPEISVLEYSKDLELYYKSGYGYDENSRLNCRLVQDMLKKLQGNAAPNAIAYFTDSVGMETFLTALGVGKDEVKLLANNYQNLTQRRWMTSYMDPFASNFVAVKYDCNYDTQNRERVIFFLNQNAVDLDWCNVGLCSWSEVMKRYETLLNADCGSYYCRSGSNMIGISFVALLMAAIFYLIH